MSSHSPIKDKPVPKEGCKSPTMAHFLIPSPIVTRRTRTTSMSRLASEGPLKEGTIARFDRCIGHGFIQPSEEGAKEIFCHISDIEGELIPMTGDLVTYKECPVPPKKTKYQAAEVTIVHCTPERHLRWEDPAK